MRLAWVLSVLLAASAASAAKGDRPRFVQTHPDWFRTGMRGFAAGAQGVGATAIATGRPLLGLALIAAGTGGGALTGRDEGAPKIRWRTAARHPLRTAGLLILTRPSLRRQLEVATIVSGLTMTSDPALPGVEVLAGGALTMAADTVTGQRQLVTR